MRYDHTLQVLGVTGSDRETCADRRDFCLTVAINQISELMRCWM